MARVRRRTTTPEPTFEGSRDIQTIKRFQAQQRAQQQPATPVPPVTPRLSPSPAQPQPRQPATPAVPSNVATSAPPVQQQQQPTIYRSRDGLVTYNSQGQRLDSNGNVARRTSRSPRRSFSGSTPTFSSEISSGEGDFSTPSSLPPVPPPALGPEGNPYLGLNPDGINQVLALQGDRDSRDFQYANDFVEALRRWNLQFGANQRQAAFNVAGRAQLPNSRFL